ncbi:MAG: hypothetical protein U1D06_02405, partial [Paracoccaceae bacterium]|nr:hypothetical protein [Paracoccaceae bacterium]
PVCPKAGAPPRMRLRNRKIDAICPKKVSQRRSDGHLGEAEAVNQTFPKHSDAAQARREPHRQIGMLGVPFSKLNLNGFSGTNDIG